MKAAWLTLELYPMRVPAQEQTGRQEVPRGSGKAVWTWPRSRNKSSLRRILTSYFDYYHGSRTHLSLGKDSPEPRAIQPPEMGPVVVVPQVGGLHHRYERRAA